MDSAQPVEEQVRQLLKAKAPWRAIRSLTGANNHLIARVRRTLDASPESAPAAIPTVPAPVERPVERPRRPLPAMERSPDRRPPTVRLDPTEALAIPAGPYKGGHGCGAKWTYDEKWEAPGTCPGCGQRLTYACSECETRLIPTGGLPSVCPGCGAPA